MSQHIALITGASRGIGHGILKQLCQKDNLVVVGTATSETGANKITDTIHATGAQGIGLTLDVTDTAQIQAALDKIETKFGSSVQILINNAGITRDNLMLRMKDDEWDAVINTNLSSVYQVSKACLKSMMKERFGRIVNIGSIVGSVGNPGQVNYCAAKAGVIGMTKSMAQELASRNITVNVIAPGFIQTDMTDALPDSQREALLSRIPIKRLGQAKDIAHAVDFLIADEASYITGQTLHINGGMLMP